ncbi:tetratricopeptide repeat protein 12 [Latimeria chalumnae]|uniref:tetratricopeptide repeat protein 12 n=1 Tax=Latimeria chalumnae TaxID=7897 RepID=UPI0006D94049|nr:PREDICTED: tetratricopeptide repeat protein 12 [Latimeria chalumnae]|eukprot:XP_005987302.2 PREDICTED: tetratricopeptide repeat protein 12 [Latimeria chalumnae]
MAALEMQRFLREVDAVTELIQGMNSDDPAVREKSTSEADKRISAIENKGVIEGGCRTKLNRTVIDSNPTDARDNPEMNQENFLKILEQDAQERAKRRKENEKLANALKQMGNEAFAKGDYGTAIQRYTEGLEKLKDMQVLYTNRAQAYIKLEKHREAISDCEWALRCNDRSIKAYVHMGRANLGLKNYKEAVQCYKKILDIDSKQENLVQAYVTQVEIAERKSFQEKEALEEFEQGKEAATSVKELLQKLAKTNQVAIYYAGGIKLLTEWIKDCTEQTLFRMHSGFSIINDNEVISRCLSAAVKDVMEVELCLSVLVLWQTVCEGNEENQQVLVTWPNTSKQLIELLCSEVPEVQKQCVALLSLYSQTEHGRNLILNNLDLSKLLQTLMPLMSRSDTVACSAVGILTNLALEKRFKIKFRANVEATALPPFSNLLKNIKLANQSVLPQCISVMGNLASDEVIRKQLSESKECWEACLTAMDDCLLLGNEADYRETLFMLLGLMVNLSLKSSCEIQEKAVAITSRCLSLLSSRDGEILTRTAGLLSHVLPQSAFAVEEAVRGGLVKKIMQLLKASGQTTTRYCIRTLAACTKASEQARSDTVQLDKKFRVMMRLLSMEDDQIVGNAALCLGHCLELPGTATSLLRSDVVKTLLSHAGGDTRKTAVQQNAAVALGKLCSLEPRHLTQLRELHGLEILNSCMKYFKE